MTKNWTLITGGSNGIGLAFAEELASANHNLILVSRNNEKLLKEVEKLTSKHGINIKTIATDLSTREGVDTLIKETADVTINFLINNVGKEESGSFLGTDINEMVNSVNLNCTAPLILSHHFGNLMKQNSGGEIMFISSIVAFQGVPLISNYAATKSYNLILAEGLAGEFKQDNIKVSVITPGFTKTNLSPEISFSKTIIKPMSAQDVAHSSLAARSKKLLHIPGGINKFLFYSGKYLQPRRLNSFAFGKVFKNVLANKLARLAS